MIHLIVPGLRGFFPRFAEVGEVPCLPALETLLARGERGQGGSSIAGAAFALFGVDADPVATAALCHAADVGNADVSRVLLHAHPVHLVSDRDRLLALDFHAQSLSTEEATAFVEAFNRYFGENGLELLAPHPERWYLAVEQVPRACFHPLADVLGRNIDHFLPEGDQASYWRALLNEVQMLFHGLPVNTEREARGLWPVNGLWLSGPGRLPLVHGGRIGRLLAESSSPPFVEKAGWEGEVYALFSGLLRCARVTGPDRLWLELDPGRAVLDGDFVAWCQALRRFDERLGSLLGESLILYDAAGQTWHWRPAMRWRIWRRPQRIVPAAR